MVFHLSIAKVIKRDKTLVFSINDLWVMAGAFVISARGAMEIILGLVALENGLINEKVFVSLVIMALVTSMSSGPLMKWLLKK